MKRINKIVAISMISMFAIVNSASAGNTHSGQSVNHAAKSGSHASGSAAHSIMSSGQVASAVVAIPFAIVGSVGEVSKQISEDLIDVATTPIGEPLEITDESFIVGPPPNDAIKLNRI